MGKWYVRRLKKYEKKVIWQNASKVWLSGKK